MPNCLDLTGQQFKTWKVIRKNTEIKGIYTYWICECVYCGAIKTYKGTCLKNLTIGNCDCHPLNRKEKKSRAEDLTGKNFGKWQVLERDWDKKDTSAWWKVKCSCGNP